MIPASSQAHRGLGWLVSQLDAQPGVLDEPTTRRLLAEADLNIEDVKPYVQQKVGSYARRTVARRENYELLVLTWTPSQGSVAHDHCGSLCGLKVIEGKLTEYQFDPGPDGNVRRSVSSQMTPGEIIVDPGVVIHALANEPDSRDVLVTVHIYSPPLPEIRRYAVTDQPPAPLFTRRPPADAHVIAILGGGFTGTMVLANLLRLGRDVPTPVHIVLTDRQPAIGEGVAYRTNDSRHLLNVPADKMSAWPDRPSDFLEFARNTNPSALPGDFLSRRIYGAYLRKILHELAQSANEKLSVEIVRDEAARLVPTAVSGWKIQTSRGRTIYADATVITVGHRPPDDPFGDRWIGPRHRFINDPWAALVLNQIGGNEPVLVIGSGLTAVDTILTLDRPDRVAPLIVMSRRGLMPLPHVRDPLPEVDVRDLIAQWLDPAERLTIRNMVRTLRRYIAERTAHTDWRQIVDALRLAVPRLWERLNIVERKRFLEHLRPFWEVCRHRMAPEVADTMERIRASGILQLISGEAVSAVADADGVNVTLSPRDGSTDRNVRVSWVVNCTGPGIQNRHTTHPILRPLIESGTLCDDEMSLGVQTDPIGRAIDAGGQILPTLLVAGTLRKSTLWESTAVPELRQQAQTVAQAVLTTLLNSSGETTQGTSNGATVILSEASSLLSELTE